MVDFVIGKSIFNPDILRILCLLVASLIMIRHKKLTLEVEVQYAGTCVKVSSLHMIAFSQERFGHCKKRLSIIEHKYYNVLFILNNGKLYLL